MIERCRTCQHKATCEYNLSPSSQSSICSCRMWKVDRTFDESFPNCPVKSRLTRFALSPPFVPAYVEGTREFVNAMVRGSLEKLDIFQYMGAIPETVNLDNPESRFRCRRCGKEAPQKCPRCQTARYCSKSCQDADWEKYKLYCNAANWLA